MKVAVISRVARPFHPIGGLESHVGSLVRHLVRRDVAVTLYTTPSRNVTDDLTGARVEFVPYRLIPWPRRSGFIVADRVTNYIAWSLRAGRRARAAPVDIVQAEAGAGFGYAWFRPPVGGAPLVLHPHGMEEFKTGWLKRSAYFPLRWAVRYAARRAERVLIPDHAMADDVRKNLSVSQKKSVVLPNAIDLEVIDRRVPAETRIEIQGRLGIEGKSTMILSVGRLESNKGFSFLAEALARSRGEIPHPWIWVLVGEGPEDSRLRRKVRALDLAGKTRFAGRVSDTELAALYWRANLFAHPTLFEGSSQVTLEAMAHGRPVVATAVGGIPSKVAEGESGFLVPPGDAEALASALVKAFSLGRDLAELGRQGRRRVESEFSWTERARKLIDLYKELLSPSR